MKGKSNFGYKFLFFIALVALIANAAARGHRPFFAFYPPDPDSTGKDSTVKDTTHDLHFPIHDQTGNPIEDYNRPSSMDLHDPKNVIKGFDYDADSGTYNYNEKFGSNFLRDPTYLTLDEYEKYRAEQEQNAYWQRRLDALMLFNKKPELPQMYKDGLFDRIFGNNTISVKPQGNVDVTFGGNWQNIKNPALVQRAQKYGVFDFDMQMNINLLATVGDKLKLNISNNTKATFDYQNVQKLDYSGKEDEIIKKIEAGNVSFPLKSNLITGVQSLFGLKAQLQFGKLWVTGVISQQKSQRKSIQIQGGAQTQQIAIKADNYEENKDFLLGQYFHDNYDNALKNYPIINSLVTMNRIEVWVTNRTGAVTGVRQVMAFMDLGEKTPYDVNLANPAAPVPNGVPDNGANRLYTELLLDPTGRLQSNASNVAQHYTNVSNFAPTTARQLATSEYSFNPQLGYIMLNTQLNPDDVLAVAYRYTYKGKVFQVGEFAEDLPPDTSNQKVLFLKLLKGVNPSPNLPIWKLMMKNIYALGGLGVSKDNFTLNILYQDPGGGEKRYLPGLPSPYEGVPLLSILNLDRLNSQGVAQPDGVFDFVDGITINTQQGKIIFPELEPFGSGLAAAVGNNVQLQREYLYQVLYDSTKTIALQSQQNDRYIMRGTYKSSSSSEIFLGGFNIPPGSVTVTAGGTKLVENTDYQIDYGLGRIKILNTGILNSGVPINIQYEDNSTFGFQQQNFMGARVDYYLNKKLTIGGTFMRLNERPFTQKVTYGDDPIKNTVLGIDANYNSELPALTRALDKLPIYSTTAPSFITASGEGAALLPGHPKQINSLDPEGAVYIDDFEGTTSTYDMKFPALAWSLSSAPVGAINKTGQTLFPEASLDDNRQSGINRALLSWYTIEPTLVDPGSSVPSYVKNEPLQHMIRLVQQNDVFPNNTQIALQTSLSTFDLGYYPKQRGPYNFDASANVNIDGTFSNPQTRWGGITRPIDNTDFEAANVEFIQFWVLDPFTPDVNGSVGNPQGGSLYFNLGDVSEDVLKDSRMFFENGIPYPADPSQLDTTTWGNVPKFEQQITRAFNNDPNARTAQDVGYDGLDDGGEQKKFATFLSQISTRVGGIGSAVYTALQADPSNDNYHYYRGADFDQAGTGVLGRYKKYNNPQGNSPVTDPNSSYATSETTIPESEDIDKDNTLNENESYFQYRVDLVPNMAVGQNNLINIQTSNVKLPNGNYETERWLQFKIPIENYDHKIGGIADFRSIRFMRMFLSGWQDSVIMRFATLELGRNQWRNYDYSLTTPGENLPQANQGTTDFAVTSVSIEENGQRSPINYVIPPGVNRQLASVSNGQNVQLNEQALSLKACTLQDGDARAVYKEVNVDMRQFSYLRMFMHSEAIAGTSPLNNGDVNAFIRIGSDFTNNYYEYDIPLTVTQPGTSDPTLVWPAANEMDLTLQDLITAKEERDAKKVATYIPYYTKDSKGNTIVILGEPNIGAAKNIMLGLLNPKKTSQTAGDDGLPKCTEVWFDELRMAGINDQAGYAAAGKVALQLADLGNINLSGSMHTAGYGSIDQKIEQRSQDEQYQYNAASNLSLGKLFPKSWGVQAPLFVGYTQTVSTPKYDPYDQDIILNDELKAQKNAAARDSIRKAAQDFTSITSINLTNLRIMGNTTGAPAGIRMPWSLKNFDFSYSFNDQYQHNPTVAEDNLVTNKLGIGYTYSVKTKPFEPFKHLFKSKSKWLSPIKDFNITYLPSNFTFRTNLSRVVEETQVRNTDPTDVYNIPPTFYKNFTWTRLYTLRWELTKSLSFDYTATNNSVINEPYGKINTRAKEDSLWTAIKTFGHNTYYTQTFNSTYSVPFAKLPATDWINVRLGYAANYSWTGALPVEEELGNTIGNTNTKQFTGELNLTTLYNKNRWLRALNKKTVAKKGGKGVDTKKGGGAGGKGGNGSLNTKDLRSKRGNGGPGGGNSVSPANGNTVGASSDVNDAGPTGGNGAPGTQGNTSTTTGNTGNTGGGGNGGNSNGNTAGGNAGGNNGNTAGGGGNPNNPNNPNNPGNPGNPNGPGSTGGTGGGKGTAGGTGKGGSSTTTPGTGGSGGTGTGGSTKGTSGSNFGSFNPGGSNSINTSNMTDDQLDSMVHVQKEADAARAKAEKEKRKKARIAARKLRRSQTPVLTPAEEIIGHLLTSVTRVTLNYTATAGTVLPGWMDSTRFMGINNYTSAPGLNFVYGYQPTNSWLTQQANANRLSRDSLFNSQYQQTYSQNLNATATLVPYQDIRIDLTLTKTFSKSNSELYKDTGTGTFNHLDPYQTGSFNISYISLFSMFKNSGVNSAIFNQFLADRQVISTRLGNSNPYTNGLNDPSNPGYKKGYGPFSQDVLIPAFLAAYAGHSASSQPLIDYSNAQNIQSDPFKYYYPLPNWRITYNGLSKLPFFSTIFTNFVVNHAYTGTMSMNGFSSSLLFNDLYGLGFPSFFDSVSHNYVPFYQVPNVTISQAFNPLIGFDMSFKNNLTAKFELRKSKMESLSLIDYQVSDNTSTEYVVGAGYRIKGLRLPFTMFGVQKLKNELIVKLDLGFRNDISSDNILANNINVVSRGQKVIRISPTVDYSVSQKLTLHFFYDRQQTIPYVSSSYPTTNTRAGVTLRFIFAQ